MSYDCLGRTPETAHRARILFLIRLVLALLIMAPLIIVIALS